MPTNRIRVILDEGVKVKAWDKDGNKYNITDIFDKINSTVTRGGGGSVELQMHHTQNSLAATLKFQCSKNDLKLDVDEGVINQILELGANGDDSPGED